MRNYAAEPFILYDFFSWRCDVSWSGVRTVQTARAPLIHLGIDFLGDVKKFNLQFFRRGDVTSEVAGTITARSGR